MHDRDFYNLGFIKPNVVICRDYGNENFDNYSIIKMIFDNSDYKRVLAR